MKIINNGLKRTEAWLAGKRLRCKRCDTEVELEADDFKQLRFSIIDDCFLIECPVCEMNIAFRREEPVLPMSERIWNAQREEQLKTQLEKQVKEEA